MERVYRHYGESGHLFPYDIRYDPDDVAHCEVMAGGRARFRLLAEPGFTAARVAAIDGAGTEMTLVGSGGRFDVWEAEVETGGEAFDYTFALRTAGEPVVYRVPSGVTTASERLDYWTLEPAGPSLSVPDWARGAVIYQIFPERFASADPILTPQGADGWGSPPHSRSFQGGDLGGIGARVDYLADLGVDIVYLNPIFLSPSNHRYDTIDFYEVDPALGGNEALADLVDELHARDIRLILDASFNHCHPRYFAFADVVEKGPASQYWSWFQLDEHPPVVRYRPHVVAETQANPDDYLAYLAGTVAETGIPLIAVDDDGPAVEPSYDSWYGVPTMPRIMLSDPGARSYMLEVAAHWITEYGIDGWRMDVVRYVDPDFWNDFRTAVRAVNPDAYLLCEVVGNAAPWLQGDRFDATMNYTFRDLSVDFFATGRSDAPTFVEGLQRMYGGYAPAVNEANQNLLSSHDTERFLTAADGRSERLALATLLQMTAPGAPGLYYGDEVGMTGGEDPGSRGAFPTEEDSWDVGLLENVRRLTRLRRSCPALRLGAFAVVWQSPDAFAFTRSLANESLLVVINRGEGPLSCEIPTTGGSEDEVVFGFGEAAAEAGAISVTNIPAWSGLVVRLS